MVDVIIYTRPGCPYCARAKALGLKGCRVQRNRCLGNAGIQRAEMQERLGAIPSRRFLSARFMSAAATIFMHWKTRASSIAR